MNVITETTNAIRAQRMIIAIQPDLLLPHRIRNQWGNALLRMRQSVDPRLSPRIRRSSAAEIPRMLTASFYCTARLAKKGWQQTRQKQV